MNTTYKTIIELDQKDIAEIIAEKFKCKVENVHVSSQSVCTGIGPMESYVNVCKVTVTINKKEDK